MIRKEGFVILLVSSFFVLQSDFVFEVIFIVVVDVYGEIFFVVVWLFFVVIVIFKVVGVFIFVFVVFGDCIWQVYQIWCVVGIVKLQVVVVR